MLRRLRLVVGLIFSVRIVSFFPVRMLGKLFQVRSVSLRGEFTQMCIFLLRFELYSQFLCTCKMISTGNLDLVMKKRLVMD